MKAEIVKVTPQLAQKWLENNPNNRSVRKGRVEVYARDMKAGKWNVTGQGIVLDKDGALLDGQHRLQAVIEANVSVDMLVISDMERVSTYDAGMSRSALDQINLKRNVKSEVGVYSTIGISIVRSYYGLVLYNSLSSTGYFSVSEIEAVAEKDKDELNWICALFNRSGSGVRRAAFCAALFAIYKLNVGLTKEMVEHIAYVLYTGLADGDKDAPIIALRNKLVNKEIVSGGNGANELQMRTQYMVDCLLKGKTVFRTTVPKKSIYDFTKLQDVIV